MTLHGELHRIGEVYGRVPQRSSDASLEMYTNLIRARISYALGKRQFHWIAAFCCSHAPFECWVIRDQLVFRRPLRKRGASMGTRLV